MQPAECAKPPAAGRALATAAQPEFGRIPDAVRVFGTSRSWIYREAGLGHIRLLKIGNRTLVDFASIRARLANLPPAAIRPPKATSA